MARTWEAYTGRATTLRSGETIQVARFLAVGISPAESVGLVAARRKTAPQGSVAVTIADSNGNTAPGAHITLKLEEQTPLYAYPDEKGGRWVQVHHPDMSENFVDRDGDGQADGGYAYFGKFVDGLETQNFSASWVLPGCLRVLAGACGCTIHHWQCKNS